MKPLVVYLASPYTLGDVAANVATQLDAVHLLMDMGHVPIAPLLSHFCHIYRQRPYAEWLRCDLALLRRADIVLRLPGASRGADHECRDAKRHGIPVANGWKEFETLALTAPQRRVR